MKTLITFSDMDNQGVKRGLHGAVDMVFGKNTEFKTVWSIGISLWTIEVNGVDYDVFMKADGFHFLTA